jgi:hypothetical protein
MRPSILFVALLMATSCGDKTSQPNGAADEPAAAEGAFCKEHGIAEAICTKCNPKLIPVFQAKGDWCEEHGFPESACPICHPERGGQAAVGVAEDGAPPDGTRVCFKAKDVASKVGIETFKAVERAEGAGLVATATITFDATKRALVNARSPGVIRSLKVDVGATVAKGAQLAIIDSGEVGADRSRQVSARGRVKVAESNYRAPAAAARRLPRHDARPGAVNTVAPTLSLARSRSSGRSPSPSSRPLGLPGLTRSARSRSSASPRSR